MAGMSNGGSQNGGQNGGQTVRSGESSQSAQATRNLAASAGSTNHDVARNGYSNHSHNSPTSLTLQDAANSNGNHSLHYASTLPENDPLLHRRPKTTTEFHRKQIAHLMMRNAVSPGGNSLPMSSPTSDGDDNADHQNLSDAAAEDSPTDATSPGQSFNGSLEVPPPKEFIRNVQGSSAGAGSGDFHVYRAHRRREYARQRLLEERARKEKLSDEYEARIAAMRSKDEEVTAKKRQKRQARKKNKKSKTTPVPGSAKDTPMGSGQGQDSDEGEEDGKESRNGTKHVATKGKANGNGPANGHGRELANGHSNGVNGGSNGLNTHHAGSDSPVDDAVPTHMFKKRKTKATSHSGITLTEDE